MRSVVENCLLRSDYLDVRIEYYVLKDDDDFGFFFGIFFYVLNRRWFYNLLRFRNILCVFDV